MTIIEDWQRQWIETPGNHKIRYACPQKGCGAFFDVTPGTRWAFRDEIALRDRGDNAIPASQRKVMIVRHFMPRTGNH
jgi:hypothetical protein